MITNSYVNKVIKVKTTGIVTLAEAKRQLNVESDFTDDDTYITMLIESARVAAEDYTGIDIAYTTNTLELIRPNINQLTIYESPYTSMTSIISTTDLIDSDITDYEIQNRIIDFTIFFEDNINNVDKLVVTFITGYSNSNVLYNLKSAILVKINDLYDAERTSYVPGSNFRDTKTFERLLNGNVINRW